MTMKGPTISNDFALVIGLILMFYGWLGGQYWWVFGGFVIYIMVITSEWIEDEKKRDAEEREFPID